MEDYFKDVEEESIRDNFVIVYELMDEVMDYGSPQFTDSKVCFRPKDRFQLFFRFFKSTSHKKVTSSKWPRSDRQAR